MQGLQQEERLPASTPCDQDFVRKLARSTPAAALEKWLGNALAIINWLFRNGPAMTEIGCDDYEGPLEACQAALNRAQLDMADCESALTRCSHDLEAQEKHVAALQDQLALAELDRQALQTELAVLQANLQAREAHAAALEAELALCQADLFECQAPPGMVVIPAGEFQMGDAFNEGVADGRELPVHRVWVDAFYMDRYEVTKTLWGEVGAWGAQNGYSDLVAGDGKGPDHPVHSVSWYDCVKWCNARSEMDGREPCYYTDEALMAVYRTEELAPYVKWDANGYRLPTEAEWEKAARGGAARRRFPWAFPAIIQHALANYISSHVYWYDQSPVEGCHPAFKIGGWPYTSPVGYFAPNGYGLYDMAGNMAEWCYDLFSGTYYQTRPYPHVNPRGPTDATEVMYSVTRGGSWGCAGLTCRVANRWPLQRAVRTFYRGLRCAAGP